MRPHQRGIAQESVCINIKPRKVEMLLTKNMSITATRRWTRRTKQEWDSAPLTREAVDARGDGALVGQVPGDAALVLGGSASDEGGVEDEAVLGGVSSGLEGSGWGDTARLTIKAHRSEGINPNQLFHLYRQDWEGPVLTD